MRLRDHARSATAAAIFVATTAVLSTPAHATPTWAPASTAQIHPGVQTITAGGQCTANFVFYDSSNNVYIGQAAHCASTGGENDTDCTTGSRPLNTSVTVGGATKAGKLVYSSWLAMQADPATVPGSFACQFNDFALVKLDPADYGRVNPSVPFWGGPDALNTAGAGVGDRVFTYGNSSLRLGLSPLSPHEGVTYGRSAGGWHYTVWTVGPGVPGDSGSAFLDKNGDAMGDLVTLNPSSGSNGVSDMNSELTYLRAHSSFTTLQLATGTVPFSPIA